MINIKRILCPTDLSTSSEQALRYALALAAAHHAELILCHRPDARELSRKTSKSQAIADALAQGNSIPTFERALLKFLPPDVLEKLNWSGLLLEGDHVGEAIAEAASECAADLIVMRSRRRPHRAALLGSAAESVCRTAPCPVLVTHTDERDWVQPLTRTISLQRVLVPYDFSDYSEVALNYALLFARECQAELHLLHVLPPQTMNAPEIAIYQKQREVAYHNATRRLKSTVPADANLSGSIKHALSEGQPYREILNYAEKHEIDLISIGAHGAGFGMRALFGSNVDRVLRQAPCPVLVARPLKPAFAENLAREVAAAETNPERLAAR
ncbi:MAG: universal stress protein [bacterium]